MINKHAATAAGKHGEYLPLAHESKLTCGSDRGAIPMPVLKLWACTAIGLAIIISIVGSTGAFSGIGASQKISPYQERRMAILLEAHAELDAEITGAAHFMAEGAQPTLDFEQQEIEADPYWRSVNLGDTNEDFDFVQMEIAQVRADERRCLAEAMYHEAAFEPALGQFAVADVILNRVKSPLYPNSICAVVYQGSSRRTGCQFSFTCDGALERARSEEVYKALEKRAGAILAGIHLPVSANATHYHADYVSPYWASELEPTTQIGVHKFYKFKSRTSAGRTAGLRQ